MDADKIADILNGIVTLLLWLNFIKSQTIGSKFSLWMWAKYGKRYTDWYTKTIMNANFSPNQKIRRK